jgi:hypothetical protein
MSDSLCRSVVQPIARRLTAAGSGIGSSITYLSRLMTSSTTTPYYAGTKNIVDSSATGDYREIQPGRCLEFNGTTQYVDCGDDPAFDLTTALTVSIWAKNDNALLGSVDTLISKYDYTGDKREWTLSYDINEKLRVITSLAGTAGSIWTTNNAISIDQLNHIAFSFSSGTLKVYLNGVEVAGTGAVAASIFNSTQPILIGAIDSTRAENFDGQLFDARIYNRALTDDEISAIYRQGLQPDAVVAGQPDATNLVGMWLLDDNSQTTAYDSSGNGNHGTIVGYASEMLYEGDDVPYSQQNLVGYSEGASSTFVPRDESNPANDILGNPLDYTGSVPKYAMPVDAPCLTWDGATQLLPVAGLSGSETVVRSGGTSTPSISAGQIDFTAGTCWDLLLSNGMYFPFSEGDGSTVYDVANGDSYTITGYASTMWTTATQDLFFYSFENGCRVDSGVAIPALADGSAAADGNPLTGLPGLLNSDSYNLNLVPEPDAPYQRSAIPGATFDGTDYVSAGHLTGSETVESSGGTSTPSVSAGRIDFTAGTCWDLILSDGTRYKFSRNYGLTVPDASGNGNDGTLVVNSSLAQIFAPTALETAYTLGDGRTRPHYVTEDSPNEKDFRTEII